MSKQSDTSLNLILNARKDYSISTERAGPPIWLISFTDVMALMLTFFVLLYSMSEPDPEKFEFKIGLTTYGEATFTGSRQNGAGSDEGLNLNRIDYNLAEDLDYLKALFAEVIGKTQMRDRITLKGRGDILMVYFNPTLQLSNRDFLQFLNNFEPLLGSLDNRLEVVGSNEGIGVFEDLQTLGRILRSYGYNKPISVTVRDLSKSDMRARIALAIRSNDGRRVVNTQ